MLSYEGGIEETQEDDFTKIPESKTQLDDSDYEIKEVIDI